MDPWGEIARLRAALHDAEERFHALVEPWVQAVWETEADGTVVDDSPTWRAYTGQTREEYLGGGWSDAVHPDDLDEVLAWWREVRQSGKGIDATFRTRTADGAYRWTHARVVPLRDERGAIRKWCGINIDVTDTKERNRTLEALRETDARHAFLLKLSDQLRSLSDPIGIQKATSELLVAELDVARCYYAEIDETRGTSVVVGEALRRGAPSALGISRLEDYPWALSQFRFGLPLAVEDWEATGESEAGRAERARRHIRAQLAVPLVKAGKLVAALTVSELQPRPWTAREITLLAATAERTWAAIERARAETALRDSEERYRSLFEAMEEGYVLGQIVRDSENRPLDILYLEVNPAFERIVGMPASSSVGRLRSELVKVPSPHSLAQYVAAVERNEMVRFELWSEERQRWYDIRVHPRRGDRFALLYDDITARKRADQTLRDNEARTRYLLALSDRLRTLTDADAICHAATALLAEQLDAERCYYCEIDDERGIAEVAAEHLRVEAPSMKGSYRLDRFEGQLATLRAGTPVVVDDWRDENLAPDVVAQVSTRQIRAQISVPLVKQGKLVGSFSVNVSKRRTWTENEVRLVVDTAERTWDAAERARAETALREADRRKDAFIATLSHELRTPLAAVRAAATVLSAEAEVPPREAIAVVERQAAMMSRLLDDLLDTSRMNLSRLAIEKKRVSVTSIVDAALEAVQPLIDAADHVVTVAVSPRALTVDADPVRLAQVIANLVTNAAKYTEEGGRIAVEAELHGEDVVIRVIDDGTGLAKDDLDRLFDLYSQGDNARERGKGGVGIGLALARGILALHGGWVRAESDGPGKGSRFIVGLPRFASDAFASDVVTDDSKAVTQTTTNDGKPFRVLVADDSSDFVGVFSNMLRAHGHEVLTASNGVTALAEAERARPDALVLDLGMPGLDGFEVARRVRATDWGARLPILALTGWGRVEDKRRAHDAGFDAHVTKGSDMGSLFALLEELIRSRSSASRIAAANG